MLGCGRGPSPFYHEGGVASPQTCHRPSPHRPRSAREATNSECCPAWVDACPVVPELQEGLGEVSPRALV